MSMLPFLLLLMLSSDLSRFEKMDEVERMRMLRERGEEKREKRKLQMFTQHRKRNIGHKRAKKWI